MSKLHILQREGARTRLGRHPRYFESGSPGDQAFRARIANSASSSGVARFGLRQTLGDHLGMADRDAGCLEATGRPVRVLAANSPLAIPSLMIIARIAVMRSRCRSIDRPLLLERDRNHFVDLLLVEHGRDGRLVRLDDEDAQPLGRRQRQPGDLPAWQSRVPPPSGRPGLRGWRPSTQRTGRHWPATCRARARCRRPSSWCSRSAGTTARPRRGCGCARRAVARPPRRASRW